MEKCSVCALRYECAGRHQFDCEIRNYQYYVPDEKAIKEIEKEIQGCKGKMERTNYRLEIVFESDNKPASIDSYSVQTALLTALAISVGGNVSIKGGNMKLSMWHQSISDIGLDCNGLSGNQIVNKVGRKQKRKHKNK